jgi:N-acetylneuraminic acid mutarotase
MNPNFFLFCFLSFILLACAGSDDESQNRISGNWSRSSTMAGSPRSGAVVFTIGAEAFAGLGYDGDSYVSDFYVFNADERTWKKRKSFPGALREKAVAFAINGKGYVGLGYNRFRDKKALVDFWEYDPVKDEWTQIADYGGTARYNAVGFVIGFKAYVGTGYDGSRYHRDFWEFDPIDSTWRAIPSYPGERIERGVSFVANNKGYVCGGTNNGLHYSDLWTFNPVEQNWTNCTPQSNADYYTEFRKAVRRHDALVFTIGERSYIIGGISSGLTADKTVYEFNGETLEWRQRTSFEGQARSMALAFVVNGRAFAGTGQNGATPDDDVMEFMAYVMDDNTFAATGSNRTYFLDDMWEFKPAQRYDVNR